MTKNNFDCCFRHRVETVDEKVAFFVIFAVVRFCRSPQYLVNKTTRQAANLPESETSRRGARHQSGKKFVTRV